MRVLGCLKKTLKVYLELELCATKIVVCLFNKVVSYPNTEKVLNKFQYKKVMYSFQNRFQARAFHLKKPTIHIKNI